LFASYLGGQGNDAAYVLSLAPGGNIYVAGGTESNNFPGNHAATIGPGYRVGLMDLLLLLIITAVQCYVPLMLVLPMVMTRYSVFSSIIKDSLCNGSNHRHMAGIERCI